MRHMRNLLLPAGICIAGFLLGSITLSQTPLSQAALSKMSDKDLFKKADTEDKAGRLESAREAMLVVVQRAIDKKKKPDKKYQDLLDSLNTRLADREVEAGEAACSRGDLAGCQKQIAAAKRFTTTPRVTQLENGFSNAVTKLRQEYQSTRGQADSGDPEPALARLQSLARYEEFLPNLRTETERVRGLFLQKLGDEGRSAIAEKRWEDASMRFQRMLDISPNNEQARAGMDRVERGRKAFQLSAQADELVKAQHFEDAFAAIGTAIASFPEAKAELEQTNRQISRAWVDFLMAGIPSLLENQDDLAKSREAYLRIQKVLELEPGKADAPPLLQKATQSFVPNSALFAQKLAEIKDLSRIATATILKYDVQRLMPDLISPEDLKSAMGNFNSKRVCQLVLSVEDLASAAGDFTQSIQARTRSVVDKQSLRDLRLRTRDDYEKLPGDNAQFQSLMPDGKSYTALLTVNINRYDFRKDQTASDVKSRYVGGTEKVPNPDYEKLSKQADEVRRALSNPSRKKGKPTREGWTESDLERLSRELDRTDKLIDKDKEIEYTYQKIEYKQSTNIEIEIVLKDNFSKEVIAQDKSVYSVEQKGEEKFGVKDRDVTGVQNQPLRLLNKDESLAEGARVVRAELDKKIPVLLRAYTDRFFNEGERALAAGRLDDAVEAYLCHWAFFAGHLDSAQMKRITAIVKGATAFDLENHGDKLMAQLLTVPVVQ